MHIHQSENDTLRALVRQFSQLCHVASKTPRSQSDWLKGDNGCPLFLTSHSHKRKLSKKYDTPENIDNLIYRSC